MKLALLQSAIYWENTKANLEQFSNTIDSIGQAVDLIILPEMFSTGFTMTPHKVAQRMNGETVSWMKKEAFDRQLAICGSVVISENGNYFNRLLFVSPDGQIKHYDKRHLFTLAGEEKNYTRGEQRLVIEYKGFKLCPLVCYDLRFPVFSRNTEDYDVLIYVANWPEPRITAWDALLKARAIENMSYVIGVNRIGQDDNSNHYNGHSQVLDCFGNYLIAPRESAGVFIIELDKNQLLTARRQFGFLNDRDDFRVI